MKSRVAIFRIIALALISISPLIAWLGWKENKKTSEFPPEIAKALGKPVKIKVKPGPNIFREPRFWTNQFGEQIDIQKLIGKPYLATFIYTRCFKECLLTIVDLKRIEKMLGGDKAKVNIILFSFDPENDTPAVLEQYSKKFDVSQKRWTFLTSTPKELKKITEDFKFEFKKQGDFFGHTVTIAIIGKDGKILRQFYGNNPSYREIVKEFKNSFFN